MFAIITATWELFHSIRFVSLYFWKRVQSKYTLSSYRQIYTLIFSLQFAVWFLFCMFDFLSLCKLETEFIFRTIIILIATPILLEKKTLFYFLYLACLPLSAGSVTKFQWVPGASTLCTQRQFKGHSCLPGSAFFPCSQGLFAHMSWIWLWKFMD